MAGLYRSFYTLVAVLAGLALVLSACGGPAEPEAEPTEAAEAPEEATEPAEEATEAPPEETEETADEEARDDVRQAFGGGPVGGAFQTFANAMSLILQEEYGYLDIAAEGTGGSGANLRGVNANDYQYGIVYAGDAFLGERGLLPEDDTEYTNVRPAASLTSLLPPTVALSR
jgi:hypothetical protein